MGQKGGADALAAGGEDADLALQALRQLLGGIQNVVLIRLDIKVLRQPLQHLGENGAGDEDCGFGAHGYSIQCVNSEAGTRGVR